MTHQIISAGFGGQGVLLLGQLLAYAGLQEGKNVSWLPSYGPEMRGGTANCCVVVSEEEVGSPVVTEADVVIVMNRPSFEKYEASVAPGGKLFVNSSGKCHCGRDRKRPGGQHGYAGGGAGKDAHRFPGYGTFLPPSLLWGAQGAPAPGECGGAAKGRRGRAVTTEHF